MGNSSGSFSIAYDGGSGNSTAGSTVSGRVILNVVAAIDCGRSGRLSLAVRGEEKCKVRYTETRTTGTGDNRRTETVTRYAYASRPLLHQDIPVDVSKMFVGGSGTVNPGRYEFPFSFALPTNLPTSMKAAGQGGNSSISYNVKASLGGTGGFFKSKIKTEVPLIVQAAPLDPEPVPYLREPLTKEVKFCCCFNRGSMSLATGVSDTRIGRGQEIPLQVAIQNDSSVKVGRVLARVMEKSVWCARGRTNQSVRTVASADITSCLSMGKGSLEGKSKEEVKSEMKSTKGGASAHARENAARNREAMLHSVTNNQDVVNLRLVGAHDTYRGQCMETLHELQVEVEPAESFVKGMKAKIPIQIGTAPLVTSQPSAPPEEIEEEESTLSPSMYNTPSERSDVDIYATAVSPEEGDNVPNAEATVVDVPPNTPVIVASTIAVPTELPIVGGHAVPYNPDDPPPEPSAPPLSDGGPPPPSFELLLTEMSESVNDKAIVQKKASDRAWTHIFESITPAQFASMIEKTDLDHYKPSVAEIVAPMVTTLTCDHVVAVIRVSSWNAVNVVKKMLPYVSDLDKNIDKIKMNLSDWDNTLLRRDFEQALKH